MRPIRQRSENVLNQTTRFLQLVKSDCHACGYVTVGAANLFYGQLGVRLARQVAAQIKGLSARPAGESREPQACRQFGRDVRKPLILMTHTLVFVVITLAAPRRSPAGTREGPEHRFVQDLVVSRPVRSRPSGSVRRVPRG
jgi:hypothetical protein